MTSIPQSLQAVLWSRSLKNLDLEKDKSYIIHQVLAYGTWDHLKWLFKTYSESEIRKVFYNQPEKDYTERSFNFVKNILLEIPEEEDIDKRKYVKTFPRK